MTSVRACPSCVCIRDSNGKCNDLAVVELDGPTLPERSNQPKAHDLAGGTCIIQRQLAQEQAQPQQQARPHQQAQPVRQPDPFRGLDDVYTRDMDAWYIDSD